MPLINSTAGEGPSLGATKELGPWEITALVGAGACVAAPTAVVLGSLQTTFVVGGAVATAGAVAAHRVANGKDAMPDFFKKKDDAYICRV